MIRFFISALIIFAAFSVFVIICAVIVSGKGKDIITPDNGSEVLTRIENYKNKK